jgi:long-chain fatty acid transport protein
MSCSHCDQPVQTTLSLFNILAPGVIQYHPTVGCSKKLGERKKSVHAAIVYGLPASVEGHNPMDNQMIKLKMNQLELELAFTF